MMHFGTSVAEAQENEKLVKKVAGEVDALDAKIKKLPPLPRTPLSLRFTNDWPLYLERVRDLAGYYLEHQTYGMMSDEQKRQLMTYESLLPTFKARYENMLALVTPKRQASGGLGFAYDGTQWTAADLDFNYALVKEVDAAIDAVNVAYVALGPVPATAENKKFLQDWPMARDRLRALTKQVLVVGKSDVERRTLTGFMGMEDRRTLQRAKDELVDFVKRLEAVKTSAAPPIPPTTATVTPDLTPPPPPLVAPLQPSPAPGLSGWEIAGLGALGAGAVVVAYLLFRRPVAPVPPRVSTRAGTAGYRW